MTKNAFILFVVTAVLLACNNEPQQNGNAQNQIESTVQGFGEPITADEAMEYSVLLNRLSGVDSLPAKVNGRVETVCQNKGCWMNISAGGDLQPEMFVQFKDYGFFVPKDIAGREVIIEGYAYREVTSVEDLRHFAKDKGQSKEEIEAITEPKEELKFLASGVLLLPDEGRN